MNQQVSFDVPGGTLHGLRFGDGPRLALAAHGITANATSWSAVAGHLPDDWSLVAPDLRGRGASRDLPGPYGLRVHALDLQLVAEQLGAGPDLPVVLAGHSMGAFVAVHAAHGRPDLFSRVVLVDGGVALPFPEGADPDDVLRAALGPAVERLTQTFPSVEAYVDFFRAHPALTEHWNDTVEAYVRHDAMETPEGIRSRVVAEAVLADGRDLLVSGSQFEPEVLGTPLPVEILAAPYGMFGQPGGLLPVDGLAAYDDVAQVEVSTVPGVNHYTILFDPLAAEQVADAVTDD
jgi:pimeloyl-ACP methyl ester carboxylesterase